MLVHSPGFPITACRACRTTVVVLATVWIVAALLPPAGASGADFHGSGVGSCQYCHIMHKAANGQVALDGSRPLLLTASSTDLCLMCHGEDGVFGANPLSPPRELGAGNFVWLLEDDLNDARDSVTDPMRGESAGHSIVSPNRGTAADARWDRAPGGTFPSHALGCTSCHDPHGSGAYRMLNGAGSVQGGTAMFLYPAPVGEGLDIRDPGAQESLGQHSAYRSGMSNWCANCHGYYHSEGSQTAFEHPTDSNLDSDERQRYNAYEGDASPGSGTTATSYLPQVPFEGPSTTVNGTGGPTTSDRLTCLTCHRAHASSAPAAGRWDFNVYRLDQDGVRSGSYPLPNPYPGAAQGQLCKKCHDENHEQGAACMSCHGGRNQTLFPKAP